MKKLILGAALALATSACSSPSSNGDGYFDNGSDISSVFGRSSNPKNVGANAKNPRPPESYQEQWYTTPDQCSYSRAKAPGYPQSWHLILNPHHIGKPNAHAGCPVML